MSRSEGKSKHLQVSPLSVVKLKQQSPNSPPVIINQISSIKNVSHLVSVSPQMEMNFNPSSSPRMSKTSQHWNAINNNSKIFKKQIHMHQKQLKTNPRIKLIQNTQKLINNRHSSFDKYILHSTKKLKIIAQNNHTQKTNKDNVSFHLSQAGPKSYFISSLFQQNQHTEERMTQSMDERRRNSSQQSKRIFKGITSRKTNKLGRFSLQLQKYNNNKSSADYSQNEQDFVQHKKINLYQSLIYQQKLKTTNLIMPAAQSFAGADYARIDRLKSPMIDHGYVRRRGKTTRQGEKLALNEYTLSSGFPTKKIQNNQPQVLTIHIKRPENHNNSNKFKSSLMNRQEKNIAQYYHPRPIPISNINIFKRPNTTLVNGRGNGRRDSEIEPW